MPSNKPLIQSIFLVIVLILLTLTAYHHITSVEYQRAFLLVNPEPIPFYFDRVFPEPGATISSQQVEGYPCFFIDNSDGLLGISFREELGQFDKFEMLINGNPEYFSIGILSLGDDDEFDLCYRGSLSPGSYLTEVRVHGVIYKTYSWAFTLTEN